MTLQRKIQKLKSRTVMPMRLYKPKNKTIPALMLPVTSAWKGLELIIEDILKRFDVGRESCIEFGVEFGYSAVVFSNYFNSVKGVDIFIGDEHTNHKGDHFDSTKDSLKEYKNIELFKADYKDWIKTDHTQYDFAHVDIVHNYAETFECGLWAARHSKVCIFHDTESFPEVRRAVYDIAKAAGKKVYNYRKHYGLGIIV